MELPWTYLDIYFKAFGFQCDARKITQAVNTIALVMSQAQHHSCRIAEHAFHTPNISVIISVSMTQDCAGNLKL